MKMQEYDALLQGSELKPDAEIRGMQHITVGRYRLLYRFGEYIGIYRWA